VARSARAHRRTRCSAPGGDSTGERRWLCQARWGSGVLTGDGRQRWGREKGLTRWQSSGGRVGRRRGLTARGGDGGGEARSKRADEGSTGELTKGERNGSATAAAMVRSGGRGHKVTERGEGGGRGARARS
jgi:hypothetical protein